MKNLVFASFMMLALVLCSCNGNNPNKNRSKELSPKEKIEAQIKFQKLLLAEAQFRVSKFTKEANEMKIAEEKVREMYNETGCADFNTVEAMQKLDRSSAMYEEVSKAQVAITFLKRGIAENEKKLKDIN